MNNDKSRKAFYNKKKKPWRDRKDSNENKNFRTKEPISVNEIEKKFNSLFDKTISNLTQGLDKTEIKKTIKNPKSNNFNRPPKFNNNNNNVLIEFRKDFENYKSLTDKKLDLIINYLKKLSENKPD